MLEDVACSRTFSTASPDSVTSVTCAQCEPALIREEHRVPMANLPVLVFSGKCQSGCTVLGCEHRPHLWTSGPHTTLMESVSHSLSRNMHMWPAGGRFVGLWQCSSCSSLHKGPDSAPAAGLLSSYGPHHVSWCTGLSPGISSMLLTLCWETQQTFLPQRALMCHPG